MNITHKYIITSSIISLKKVQGDRKTFNRKAGSRLKLVWHKEI